MADRCHSILSHLYPFLHRPWFSVVVQNNQNSEELSSSFWKIKKEKRPIDSVHLATGCYLDNHMSSASCFYPVPWNWKMKVSLIRSATLKKDSLKVNVVGWSKQQTRTELMLLDIILWDTGGFNKTVYVKIFFQHLFLSLCFWNQAPLSFHES